MIKLRTLVVDDELGMRLSIKKALSKHVFSLDGVEEVIGYEVDIAETGEEALEKLSCSRPDILLLDYKLPGISGLDLLEKVKSREGEMVTIMITAYASIETAVTAVKRGAFDFIAKPFTPAELKTTVNKAAQSLILARQVRKLAQERRQVRFQFISVLGHELKSPLNSIEGYLDIMQRRILGENIQSYDKMIDRCMDRIAGMRKLIMDLLDLTRIESGQKKRELRQTDIKEIAELSRETMLPAAREKNVSINIKADEPVIFYCDRSEIEIVLNNLISNAVKYNNPNGQVDVSIKKESDKLIISVKDTGIGMTKEEAARLFNEFTRIRNEKTKEIEGSGLGLAIVKKISQLYDGTIGVETEPDRGSKFTVILKEANDV